jgi:hypothetical protein
MERLQNENLKAAQHPELGSFQRLAQKQLWWWWQARRWCGLGSEWV